MISFVGGVVTENTRCARSAAITNGADRVELAFVEDASHFVTDDAPDAVAALALEWFRRAG